MKNKKLIIITGVIVLVIILIITGVLFSIRKDNLDNAKLYVTESSWSGWVKDYKPEEVTNEYDIILNKKTTFKNNFSFTIVSIGNDYIKIKTNTAMMSDGDSDGLMTDKVDFIVKKGDKLELTTPTMDAGDIYIFEIK